MSFSLIRIPPSARRIIAKNHLVERGFELTRLRALKATAHGTFLMAPRASVFAGEENLQIQYRRSRVVSPDSPHSRECGNTDAERVSGLRGVRKVGPKQSGKETPRKKQKTQFFVESPGDASRCLRYVARA